MMYDNVNRSTTNYIILRRKFMKKLTSIILTLAMLLVLCSTAMAAEPELQVSEEAKELAEVYTIDTEFSTIKQNEMCIRDRPMGE